MPMFDFYCPTCQNQFEDLAFKDEKISCPKCGDQNTQKMVSAPSPLKTGAFPYKVGPVHPIMKSSASSNAKPSCQTCTGSCSTES